MRKTFIVCLAGFFYSASCLAQTQEVFVSKTDAVKYLNSICSKLWNRVLLPNETNYDVKIYESDCDLYFEVKDYFGCTPGESQPCLPKVLTTLTKVSLEGIVINATDSAMCLNGKKKSVSTLSFWNTTGWDKHAEFANRFVLPMTYDNPQYAAKWPSINRALTYLVQQCRD